MQLIYPPQLPDRGVGGDLGDPHALAAAYAYPVVDNGTWVRATMVSSIDGAAQGPDRRSGSLSTPADRRVLSLLRALADVILVGAGTARTERYGPAEPDPTFAAMRAGRGQSPAAPIAVVSRRLELEPTAALFTHARDMTGSTQRTIVFTVESAPLERRAALADVADVVVAGGDDVDITAVLDDLTERGLRRVLSEGGPRLLAHIVRGGALDELCYTMTPMLAGGQTTHILDGAPVEGSRWRLAHVIEDNGTLLTRWVAERRGSTPGAPEG